MSTDTSRASLWPALEEAHNYSQAVQVGNVIHVSATLGLDAAGTLVSDVNMQRQTHQAYANLDATLAKFGATRANVVSETVLVTDLEQARVVDLLGQAYRGGRPPARTLAEVRQLAQPTAMIAISCIAVL